MQLDVKDNKLERHCCLISGLSIHSLPSFTITTWTTLDTVSPASPVAPSSTSTLVGQGPPEGVTGNESEGLACGWPESPATLTTEQLQDAHWLPLSAVAASPGALALVSDLTSRVVAFEGASGDRLTGRRQAGVMKLQAAVGAVVGGLLRRWGRDQPEAVFRSRKAGDFTGSPVGVRQFTAAVDSLVALGLVSQSGSIRFVAFDFGDSGQVFQGKAPRFWPSSALLASVARHGVTAATIPTDFTDVIPKTPPAVPKPVQVFALRQPRQKDKVPLPIINLGPEAHRIQQGIAEANAYAAQHDVQGCLAPRWYRVFVECSLLGGRWQAAGREGVYQVMPEADRLAKITIGREAVAEVDVKASHLSIMHGLLGLPLPDGDPYVLSGIEDRNVVKAWITATLGKGSPVRRWAPRATKSNPSLTQHDAREIGRLICHRYPFLRQPARAVATAAGLDQLGHIGTPERLLTHRLMAIEAQALTGAMMYLRTARGVLALPIHDSLIVPRSGVRYVGGALDAAFSWAAKVRIRWTVDTAPEPATDDSREALQRPVMPAGGAVVGTAQ